MRVNANGHVWRSAAEGRTIVERFRQRGLGIAEFCAREGLVVRTFEQSSRVGHDPPYSFTFVSDEFNGVTQDNEGNVRPLLPRSFSSLS